MVSKLEGMIAQGKLTTLLQLQRLYCDNALNLVQALLLLFHIHNPVLLIAAQAAWSAAANDSDHIMVNRVIHCSTTTSSQHLIFKPQFLHLDRIWELELRPTRPPCGARGYNRFSRNLIRLLNFRFFPIRQESPAFYMIMLWLQISII